MGQKVVVELVDDLDGSVSADISTVRFGLDGVSYEIDLSVGNANKLRDAMADFVAAARRTGGRLKRGSSAPRSAATRDVAGGGQTRLIREWAREHGYELADRGRIAGTIIAAYEEAQAEVSKPKARRGRRRAAEPASG
jgi:hypothetical protein